MRYHYYREPYSDDSTEYIRDTETGEIFDFYCSIGLLNLQDDEIKLLKKSVNPDYEI